ncbi:MAG: hypothetical protein ACJ74Y_00855 [Bryobacteraceae bacterium]
MYILVQLLGRRSEGFNVRQRERLAYNFLQPFAATHGAFGGGRDLYRDYPYASLNLSCFPSGDRATAYEGN